MKNFLLLLCILIGCYSLSFGQDEPQRQCGTHELMQSYLKNKPKEKGKEHPMLRPDNGIERDASWSMDDGYGGSCSRDCTITNPTCTDKFRIPVVFTIMADNDCSNVALALNRTDDHIALANQYYDCEGIPIELFKCTNHGQDTESDNSSRVECNSDLNNFQDPDTDGSNDFADLNSANIDIPNVMNIYVVSTLNDWQCGGYAYYPFGPERVIMLADCWNPPFSDPVNPCSNIGVVGVLVHEVGHFLGLYHTHAPHEEGDSNIAALPSDDGCITGDFIDDTCADPNIPELGLDTNADCCADTWSGTGIDAAYNGQTGCQQTFDNIMSYNGCNGCTSEFTQCQKAKMIDALLCARNNLSCCDPNFEDISDAAPYVVEDEITICIGDPVPIFTIDDLTGGASPDLNSGCIGWYASDDNTADFNELATGLTFIPPTSGPGAIDVNTAGTYTWYFDDDLNNYSLTACDDDVRKAVVVIVDACCDASFTYDGTDSEETGTLNSLNFCISDTDPSLNIQGGTGGTFASTPAGLIINATTGAIDISASNLGSYTVSYTAPDVCTESITINIVDEVEAGTPVVMMPEVCNIADTDPIDLNTLLTGADTGGTWTESTASTGLSANMFDPFGQAAGTYTFVYTVSGGACPNDQASVSVTIVDPCCDASFDYGIDPVELCMTDAIVNANFTDPDGSFIANPATGLVIDATTGAIDPSASTPGTYTVTHSVNTNSGCEETLSVTIDGEVEAGTPVAMMPEVCNIADTDPIDLNTLLTGADTGGTWTESTASTGLSANIFDPVGQAADTYTFVYTVNGGACPNDQATVSVTIVDPCCDATFDYGIDPVELCTTDAVINANFTDPDGGFTASPATGLVIDAITGAIDPGASVPGTYTVTHSVNTNVGCEETLTVTVDGVVNAGTAEPAIEICNVPGTELVILDDLITGADTGGVWSESSATPSVGGVSPPNIFDPVGEAAGTYTFDYFMEGGACPDDTETVSVIIYEPCCEAFAGSGAVNLPLCPEDPIGLDVSAYFVDPDYNFFFVLVDADTGLIVEIIGGNSTTIASPINFVTTTPGNYISYAYSEEIGNGTTIPLAVGESIEAVLSDGECYDAAQIGGLIVMPSPFIVLGGIANTLEGLNGGIMPVYYNNHEILIGGGTQPYQYEWDRTGYVRWETTGSSDADYDEQINITYADNAEWTVTVTDANGCTDAILVFTNDDGTGGGNTSVSNAGNILDIDNVLIEGESLGTGGNDGVVDITMAGCDGGPYAYEWTGPNGFSASTEDITALESGFYTVVVTCGDQETSGYYWVPLSRNGGRLKTAADGLALTAYPNPFSEMSTISFMTQIGGPASLEVYDLTGRKVAELFEGETQANKVYELYFSAEDYESGIYICKLSTTDKEVITQLVLIR